jgi:hypothetical protein
MTWTGKGQGWGDKQAKPREAGKINPDRYSASQVATFRDCRRKWAFRYMGGVKTAQHPSAALGSYIHDRLQEYLEEGKLPSGQGIAIEVPKPNGEIRELTHDDIMEIMLPGLPYLPAPGEAKCEGGFSMDLGDLGEFTGYLDVLHTLPDGTPAVKDHKTTSNLRWAMTEEQLRTDVQCVSYAVYAMEKAQADKVLCSWIYYQTHKPKAKKVEVGLSLASVAKSWEGVLEDVREMKRLHESGVEASEVEHDVSACDRYGGCPYRNQECGLSSTERMRGILKMSSLKERMMNKAKPAAPKPPPAPAAQAAPPAPAPAPAGADINPPEATSALARLKAKTQSAQAPAAQAPAPAPAAQAPAPAPEAAPAAAPAPAPAAYREPPTETISGGFTLYIDCAPNRPCLDFAQVAAPVMEWIKAQHGTHYRLIDNLYGGNGALFAEALAEHLDENPLKEDLMVTLSSPIVRDAIEVLQARAHTVVRGF